VTRAGEFRAAGLYTALPFASAGMRVVEESNGPGGGEVDL
jgi:hypothetical protein